MNEECQRKERKRRGNEKKEKNITKSLKDSIEMKDLCRQICVCFSNYLRWILSSWYPCYFDSIYINVATKCCRSLIASMPLKTIENEEKFPFLIIWRETKSPAIQFAILKWIFLYLWFNCHWKDLQSVYTNIMWSFLNGQRTSNHQ